MDPWPIALWNLGQILGFHGGTYRDDGLDTLHSVQVPIFPVARGLRLPVNGLNFKYPFPVRRLPHRNVPCAFIDSLCCLTDPLGILVGVLL